MKLLNIRPEYINEELARKICKNKELKREYIRKYDLDEYLQKMRISNIEGGSKRNLNKDEDEDENEDYSKPKKKQNSRQDHESFPYAVIEGPENQKNAMLDIVENLSTIDTHLDETTTEKQQLYFIIDGHGEINTNCPFPPNVRDVDGKSSIKSSNNFRTIVTSNYGILSKPGFEQDIWEYFYENSEYKLKEIFELGGEAIKLAYNQYWYRKHHKFDEDESIGFNLLRRTLIHDMTFTFNAEEDNLKLGIYQIGYDHMKQFDERLEQISYFENDVSVNFNKLLNIIDKQNNYNENVDYKLSEIIQIISFLVSNPDIVLNFIIYSCRGKCETDIVPGELKVIKTDSVSKIKRNLSECGPRTRKIQNLINEKKLELKK
jgi:hypothetical protein